jgi:hypothetical protein
MGPGSHVGFPISAKNKNLVYDHPMNISAMFDSNLFCGFNVHWMVLYQICVFGAELKSNMAARVHNVFSLPEILKIFGRNYQASTNQNTLWALAAMLDFRSAPETKILYMTIQ